MSDEHQSLLNRRNHLLRRPLYHALNAIIATLALLYATMTFIQTHHITPLKEYIPTTTADTAVVPVSTRAAVLPTDNQDTNPGETHSEEKSITILKAYLKRSLRDCFTMNYLNYGDVMAQCKHFHLDSESSTPDDYAALLSDSGYIGLLNKYKTALKSEVSEESITLTNTAIAQYPLPNGLTRQRFLWVFELNMSLSFEDLDTNSPRKWEVEVIRESLFTKAFGASLFKIRAID